jgi:hypothetical protein
MALKSIKKFLSTVFHGLKGSAIFFMFAVALFAFWKLIYLATSRDLLLSKYTIGWIIAGFILIGFFYGIIAYGKKNHHYKLYTMNTKNFFINLVLTLVFTLYFWYVLRNKVIPSNTVYLFFAVSFVLFYAFSALISNIHHHVSKKKQKKIKKSTIAFAIIFNPVFVLIYLWLFSMVVYNSLYVPCGVSVVGIDRNVYTGNTRNLDINPEDKILSIDGTAVTSLQDVRNYMNSLDSTKEVLLETEDNTYLIETYQIDGRRYMGLILEEKVCARQY